MSIKKISFAILFTGILSFLSILSYAQCDTIASKCAKELTGKFISDGQEYRAFLVNSEVAEFHSTFYGGSVYRIVTGSGAGSGNIVFRIYDKEKHLLFNSADFNNPSSWDFSFKSTMICTIETQLVKPAGGGNASSSCAVMLIGFKN